MIQIHATTWINLKSTLESRKPMLMTIQMYSRIQYWQTYREEIDQWLPGPEGRGMKLQLL